MATGTLPPTVMPPPPPLPVESIAHERVIRQQLRRTIRSVWIVDLASSLVLWAVGVLTFFILMALADHLIGLGTTGRAIALVLLVAGSAYHLITNIVPLLVRRINPTYAARTIEEATPTLKNSLINFLLLRPDRGRIKEIIFQAVEKKAATDIAAVPVETTVDRSQLIHVGYALCGVMAIIAVYKVLSPKDPFQTVARVLAPWADIARPSRVQIDDVQPGSAAVYHGQVVTISAIVSGAREDSPVRLIYSTTDGHIIGQAVEMSLSADKMRRECTLPPSRSAIASGSSSNSVSASASGLHQDVTYRIVAGDAETSAYRLTVVEAPTIIVDRLDYQFPAYTKKSPETVTQQGDIRCLEGTQVTVYAVANQPIKSAWIEFDPSTKNAAPEVLPLVVEGKQARGTITLQLKPDRQTPWHASYLLRFYNEEGQKSLEPILHKLSVIRDLAPEVQILQPDRVRVEIPENGELPIQVRAVDPDFGLAQVRLESAAAGKPSVAIDLLAESVNHPPQASLPHAFRPRDHKLAAGDEFTFVAIAQDNRTNPLTGQPEPNISRTTEYTLLITAAPSPETPTRSVSEAPTPTRSVSEGPAGKTPPDQKPAPQNTPPQNPTNPPPDKPQQPPDPSTKNTPSENQKNQNQKTFDDQKSKGQSGEQKQQGGQGKSQEGDSSKTKSGGSGQSNDPGQASGANQPSNSTQQTGGQQSGAEQGAQQNDQQSGAAIQQKGAGGKGRGKAHDGQAIEQLIQEMQPKNGQSPTEPMGQSPSPNNQAKGGAGEQKPKGDNSQQPASQEKSAGQEESTGQEKSSEKSTGNSASQDQNQNQKTSAVDKAAGTPEKSASPQPGQPQPTGQDPSAATQPMPGTGEKPQVGRGSPDPAPQPGTGEKPDPNNRSPGDKPGENPANQKDGGQEGGSPQGQSKNDPADVGRGSPDPAPQSQPGKSEPKSPGAAKSGNEGAGTASKEKTGSAEGTQNAQDKNKDPQGDAGQPQQGDVSPPSGSKKESNSKGGQSGDQTGGGQKGSGQSAGQEGADSAGSKTPADQGAGKANESGAGEKGNQAGAQEPAPGKTGKSGEEKGDGAASRPANSGQTSGEPGSEKGEASSRTQGGGDGNKSGTKNATESSAEAADAANLEYAKKATDLALQRLRDIEHNPDPTLLEKLGWTREDLSEFLRRWEALERSAAETPDGKRELDEALKSLGLRDPANRQRAAGAKGDTQRGLQDGGNRSSPPSKYRDLFDAYRKAAARSRQ